jgi:hypothetical protein
VQTTEMTMTSERRLIEGVVTGHVGHLKAFQDDIRRLQDITSLVQVPGDHRDRRLAKYH